MSLFSEIAPVRFEGVDSSNEFAYRVYDPNRMVLNKRLGDWLKPAVCYWHSFNWPGADIFGAGTLPRPWLGTPITQAMADDKLDAAFDFFARLGAPYFTFHDVDAMATASSVREHEKNLLHIEGQDEEVRKCHGAEQHAGDVRAGNRSNAEDRERHHRVSYSCLDYEKCGEQQRRDGETRQGPA